MQTSKTIKLLAGISLAACAASASSASKTITSASADYVLGAGTSTLTYSSDVITSFALGGVTAVAVAPATYAAGATTSSLASMTYDGTTKAITEILGRGGASNVATAGLTGSGGQVSIMNLSFDPTGKSVSGDLTGSNGVMSGHYTLFNVGTVTGSTSFTGAGVYSVTGTNLSLTSQGLSLLKQGLGLNSFGANVMASITNFGTITTTVGVTASAVPEPSTWALMLLGVLGLSLVEKKRS